MVFLFNDIAVQSCRCSIMLLFNHVAVQSCCCSIMSLFNHVAVQSCCRSLIPSPPVNRFQVLISSIAPLKPPSRGSRKGVSLDQHTCIQRQ
ncbi:hypothetical protein B0O80DRAFT_464125 [Mortierella sp. GBAus27b]|nr:hypothetical protein B0O80DRAFT_464114 [Mortierella sp. GBAus27b]KAI8347965.1 hypothetical protein B0O80DRAFT_464125 [Mortierella sp. GBAus27b]